MEKWLLRKSNKKVLMKNLLYESHICEHKPYSVKECGLCVKNKGKATKMLEGLYQTVCKNLPTDKFEIVYYRSGWGQEYREERRRLSTGESFYIENTRGRSSHQHHPLVQLQFDDGEAFLIGYAWSGNWFFEINSQGDVRIGQNATMFSMHLEPGKEILSPSILIANGNNITQAVLSMTRFMKHYWMPLNQNNPIMVEWNHWWTYEDVDMNEIVFRRNADEAAELGINLCTLDAGWYGSGDVIWSKKQGDWNEVNKEKFSHGLRFLSDYVHQKGMKFGIWMEPEAMGALSSLRKTHPEFEAIRDQKTYENPYICLGNPEAEQWLLNQITAVIEESCCDWLKLDFNLDPEYGCNRTDHGHQAGNGLWEHYQGYYRILDLLHKKYPKLMIENCSSGGLRCDFGMLRHVQTTFLSDVDTVIHSLESFWVLSHFVPAIGILHWVWSQTRRYEDGSYVFPSYDINKDTEDGQLKFMLRTAMLHQMGFSRDLTSLPDNKKSIIREELEFYKTVMIQYLIYGDIVHLTHTDTHMGFQYQYESSNLVILFCIHKGKHAEKTRVRLQLLEKEKRYLIEYMDSGNVVEAYGEKLMKQGLWVDSMDMMTSEMVRVSLQEEK